MDPVTFNYTGDWQTWTVPDGVTSVTCDVYAAPGAARSNVYDGTGGLGGRVSAVIKVSPGQVLYIQVGGNVQSGGTHYTFGGGACAFSSTNGGPDFTVAGGGRSAVALDSQTALILVAGGGGGGGKGSSYIYNQGQVSPGGVRYGIGGDGARGGGVAADRGGIPPLSATPGDGGTQSAGGAGGVTTASVYNKGTNGGAGSSGVGGIGGYGDCADYGGGGGGGYYGGGGGYGSGVGAYQDGSGNHCGPATGGGGGSSYIASTINGVAPSSTINQLGVSTTPRVIISPIPAPYSPTLTGPANGADIAENSPSVFSWTFSSPTTGDVQQNAWMQWQPQGGLVTTNALYTAAQSYTWASGHWNDYTDVPISWRIQVQGQGGPSPWSDWFTFTPRQALSGVTIAAPLQNAILDTGESNEFDWTYTSTQGATQASARIELRTVSATGSLSDPIYYAVAGSTGSYVFNSGDLQANVQYLWRVLVTSSAGGAEIASSYYQFTTTGAATAPTILYPTDDEAVDVSSPTLVTWQFDDPAPDETQTRADYRWRIVGTGDNAWNTTLGDTTTPGAEQQWLVAANTWPQQHIELQLRTYNNDQTGDSSGWSQSAYFYGILTPGSGSGGAVVPSYTGRDTLGCGTYQVEIFERGGQRKFGIIGNVATLQWGRTRDDISTCTIATADLGYDNGAFYSSLRSMHHEIVLYRDGIRVWEGPITRIAYFSDHIEMDAKDVLQYVYRRIMRQSYSDVYPNVQSVIYRASRILINALAPDDPNILSYLTLLQFPDDAQESRSKSAYSTTAWEEIDDMAANAGLDYTVVGRRIALWDTHRPLGRLPVMTDGDFGDSPVVTEYGMDLCTSYSITNGSGVYGTYVASDNDPYYGLVELLSSSYSDASTATDGTLTPEALAEMQQSLAGQAQRSAAGRYPAPLEVRVPDNSQLSPDVPIGINYLVPGVWIPLTCRNTPREVTQWQKLDSITVNADASGEKVQVSMSPAPGAGQDPDATGGADDGQ